MGRAWGCGGGRDAAWQQRVLQSCRRRPQDCPPPPPLAWLLARAAAPPPPPPEEDPEGWSVYEGLLPLAEQQLASAEEFVRAAERFAAQPLLWVGAPVRVADGASSAAQPLLPEWVEPFRAACEWASDSWAPAQ